MMISRGLYRCIEMFYTVKRPENPVTLSSGRTSPLYFDIKAAMLDPGVCGSLLTAFTNMIHDFGIERKSKNFCIGGMELGGAQLAQLLVLKGYDSFIVRKNEKKYGLMKRIEGDIVSENIIIVDDVITSGNTVNQVKDIVEQQGFKVVNIMCIIDRTEDERYTSLFKEKDFL